MSDTRDAIKLSYIRWRSCMEEFTRRLRAGLERMESDPCSAQTIEELRFQYAPAGMSMSRIQADMDAEWRKTGHAPNRLHGMISAELTFHSWYCSLLQEDGKSLEGLGLQLWSIIGKARWAESAFPVVHVSSNAAANLVATSDVDGLSDATTPPWRCFMIVVDGDMLGDDVRWIMCNTTEVPKAGPRGGSFQMEIAQDGVNGERASSLWEFNRTIEELTRLDAVPNHLPSGHLLDIPQSAVEEKRRIAAGKLVAGVCLALTSDNATIRKRTAKGLCKVTHSELKGGTYVLGLPVKCDLTKEVSDWVRGRTKEITRSAVRWLVRGHWRQQACGELRQSHRRTWIAPYWKGPERAAALVRPHVIGEPEA